MPNLSAAMIAPRKTLPEAPTIHGEKTNRARGPPPPWQTTTPSKLA